MIDNIYYFLNQIGYYSEFSVMEMTVNFNQSVFLVDPESQKRPKYSYSYFGPVLIGIGGKD